MLWRTTGRTGQAYAFTAAGEISPFGVYVPTTWDGHTPLKLLLILRGVNEDQESMLDRAGGIIPAPAEKHNYLVVTPNGCRTDGRCGATNKPGRPGGPPSGSAYTTAELKYISLSEQDVLHVLAVVEKEYPIDLTHVYLMGQSMGGAGAWGLAQKYPENGLA